MVDIGIGRDTIRDVQLIIFDKDGTLIDLFTYWSNMIHYRVTLAQKKFGFDEIKKNQIAYAMGVDMKNKRLRTEGPVGLKKREIVMEAMMDSLSEMGIRNTREICCEIFKEVDELSIHHFEEIIKPIHGAHDLINTLASNTCKIAIATTDKTERAKLAMEFLGVREKIDAIIGAEMVKNTKPSTDMVDVILEELKIDKKHTIIVGDAITDVEMGINAGLHASIGVTSGLTTAERLLNITPFVISDISRITVLS
ncbi:MAG: HAD family hydrolase [Candidatus Brocadiaceae bacterium]|nr:HAD family hydrolase [Candidatus Brocadiaceae bacterium]